MRIRKTTFASIIMGLMVFAAPITQGFEGDIDILEQQLREEKDELYISARDDALELEQRDFSALLEQLRSVDDDWLGHLLADILASRRDHPELAKRFDAERTKTLTNTIRTIIGPGYGEVWLPEDSSDVDVLIFESIFKIETPGGVKGGYLRKLEEDECIAKETITPLLQLLDPDNQLCYRAVMPLGSVGRIHKDERIAPALVGLYQQTRDVQIRIFSAQEMSRPLGDMVYICIALERMGSEEEYFAIVQIIGIETELAQQHGFAPWNMDVDRLREEYRDTYTRLHKLQADQKYRGVAVPESTIDELQARKNDLYTQLHWTSVWGHLLQCKGNIEKAMRAELESDGAPSEAETQKQQ